MKFIKLFEDLESNKYYQPIDLVEWERFVPILMNKSTQEKIKKIIPCEVHTSSCTSDGRFIKFIYLTSSIKKEIKNRNRQLFKTSWFIKKYNVKEIFIFEADDEYFYVSYQQTKGSQAVSAPSFTKHYKCDQLDGLLELLKDIEFI